MERGWARRVRREVKDWLKSIPGIGDEMAEYAHRTHRSLKTVFTPGMLFEALRFNYIGPVNGHNIEEVERHLRMAASIDDQPVLLHVLTRKGKGYPPAEAQPSKFHGLGKFDVATGQTQPKPAGAPPTYTDIFGETLCRLAKDSSSLDTTLLSSSFFSKSPGSTINSVSVSPVPGRTSSPDGFGPNCIPMAAIRPIPMSTPPKIARFFFIFSVSFMILLLLYPVFCFVMHNILYNPLKVQVIP